MIGQSQGRGRIPAQRLFGQAVFPDIGQYLLAQGLGRNVLPQHKPEEWMTDPGCGYSLRLDAEMWMRDHIAEAFDIVPYGYLDGAEE